jgi:hypothetical protein
MLAGERFSWNEVTSWMATGDIELQGAAYQALMAQPSVIDGTVDGDVANAFLAEYFIRCMDAGKGEQARVFELVPVLAANSLAGLYRALRREVGASASHPILRRTRDELRRMYLEGDPTLQSRIVHGTLEHIFESMLSRADFQDWSSEQSLAEAYREAAEWGNAHLEDDASPEA